MSIEERYSDGVWTYTPIAGPTDEVAAARKARRERSDELQREVGQLTVELEALQDAFRDRLREAEGRERKVVRAQYRIGERLRPIVELTLIAQFDQPRQIALRIYQHGGDLLQRLVERSTQFVVRHGRAS